jgi:hypothetical protein
MTQYVWINRYWQLFLFSSLDCISHDHSNAITVTCLIQ